MIQTRFFRRHFGITVAVILSCVIVGFLAFFIVVSVSSEPMERRNPPEFFARLVDRLGEGDPLRGIRVFEELNQQGGTPMRLTLLDENGRPIHPEGSAVEVQPERLQELRTPFETRPAGGPRPGGVNVKKSPRPPLPFFGRPPGGHDGGPKAHISLLPGTPVRYLYVFFDRPPPPPGGFFAPVIALVASLLLGTGLAILLLFRSLRDKITLADEVISELQKGNLKARFPIKKPDEIGQAMMRFNLMADEIERLVEHLRSVESSRMKLLQELAHDLRTPIASLKNLTETLQLKRASLDPKTQDELLSLSISEIEYFERLVEDLLLLARVSEPKYRVDADLLSLEELLEDEAEALRTRYENGSTRIRLEKDLVQTDLRFSGDSHLLRRLFRNGLDNAFSFARTKVRIVSSLDEQGDYVLSIEDDGPGLPKSTLEHFGERRVSRAIQHEGKEGRLSVGLGSVIMKTVALIHGGTLEASNRIDESGKTVGARISLRFPKPKNDTLSA